MPQSKVPLCLERTHVSCVRGNFELLRMDPQTFLLYSYLPKTSYHYYHLRVIYEDRKDNLCNLCHDFPYSNHCNSIASLEILTNFIPTGNRELLGVIFFLSPRFQFVLRAEDITSFHGWRRILILSFNKSSLDSRPDLRIVSHLLISKVILRRVKCSKSSTDT